MLTEVIPTTVSDYTQIQTQFHKAASDIMCMKNSIEETMQNSHRIIELNQVTTIFASVFKLKCICSTSHTSWRQRFTAQLSYWKCAWWTNCREAVRTSHFTASSCNHATITSKITQKTHVYACTIITILLTNQLHYLLYIKQQTSCMLWFYQIILLFWVIELFYIFQLQRGFHNYSYQKTIQHFLRALC